MVIEYKREFTLRTNDFDCYDNIIISSVLDLFQTAAGEHADILGIGFQSFLKQNKIWAIIRTKFEIIKQPLVNSKVIVRTWPLVPGKIDADRCYQILSLEGEVLVQGISKWVNIDLNSRRIIRIKDWNYGEGEFDQDYGLTSNFIKIQNFETNNSLIKVRPSYLDLDHNGHVNNSKYGEFILNNIKELQDKEIVSCQIDYLCEIKKEQEIGLSYQIENKTVFVKGVVSNNVSFIAKIDIK